MGRMVFNNLYWPWALLEDARETAGRKGRGPDHALEDVEDDGAWATAAWAAWPPASWTAPPRIDIAAGRLRPALPATACSSQTLRERPPDGGARTTGRSRATPGASAATRLAVTVPMRTGRRAWPCPTTCRLSATAGKQHRHAAPVAVPRASMRLDFRPVQSSSSTRKASGGQEPRRGHHQGALPQRHAARRQADAREAAVRAVLSACLQDMLRAT